MIEVTSEMIIAGRQVLNGNRNRPTDALDAAYRAMRALEPKPEWVNTQQGAQATPGSAVAGHFGPGDYVVMPAFYHLSRPLTEKTWGAMNRRIDALTALVLELAHRTPGNAEVLVRLAAELEAAK